MQIDDACRSCRGSAEAREVPAAVASGDSGTGSDLGVVDPRDGLISIWCAEERAEVEC
jgi:hypothetical protein